MEKKESKKTVFQILNAVNVNEFTENRNGLTYLSWSNALEKVLDIYPDMSYEIVMNEQTNLPYFASDEGIMCYTKVTIDGVTRMMWLPVMDSANNAMKTVPYSFKTKYGEKYVAAATMFDINKTIMRCLTKNLAMFGLGLYIYKGEDLPTEEVVLRAEEEKLKKEAEAKKKEEEKKLLIKEATALIKKAKTSEECRNIFNKYAAILSETAEGEKCTIKDFLIAKGNEIKEGGNK